MNKLLIIRYYRIVFVMILISAMAVFEPASAQDSEKLEWKMQKQKFEEDYAQFKDNIHNAIVDMNQTKGNVKGSTKEELMQLKDDLQSMDKEIDKALKEVHNSDIENWEQVNNDLKKTYSEIKDEMADLFVRLDGVKNG